MDGVSFFALNVFNVAFLRLLKQLKLMSNLWIVEHNLIFEVISTKRILLGIKGKYGVLYEKGSTCPFLDLA